MKVDLPDVRSEIAILISYCQRTQKTLLGGPSESTDQNLRALFDTIYTEYLDGGEPIMSDNIIVHKMRDELVNLGNDLAEMLEHTKMTLALLGRYE